MSQTPYWQIAPHATPQALPPSRPTVVTAVAVAALGVGALSLLSNCMGIIIAAVTLVTGKSPTANRFYALSPGITRLTMIMSGVAIAFSIVLIIASILGLQLKPLGRKLAMAWSAGWLIWLAVRLPMQIVWVAPETLAIMQKTQTAAPPGVREVMRITVIVSVVASALVSAVLPVVILILWNTTAAKRAFAGKQDLPPLGAN